MERMKLMENKESFSANHVAQNNKIFDKDGKRETEKTVMRERLSASCLLRIHLEKEVIKDMALQWGKSFMPSENLEAGNESISEPRNSTSRIFREGQRRELEKRVIGEELLSSWLHEKELEEEVMTELFWEDVKLQRGKDSIASGYPKGTSDTCDKPHTDLQKRVHMQYKGEGSALASHVQCPISSNGQDWNDQNPDNHKDGGLTGSLPIQRSPRAPNNTNPEMFIGLGKGAMTPLNEDANVRQLHQGPISLNGQDWNEQSPGNHTDGGLAGSVPIQHSLRAPNYTNPEILNSLGKGTMTPGKIEGSTLVTYVQGPISLNGQDWNDQRPGNHTDGGLTGSLPIQCSPRAPKNTNPEMLFGLGKEAMAPLKGEGSALASHVQCPISSNGQDWNDQNPDNHKDGGLTGSLPIQRSPRAPNNTNPEMFIGLGKGAMTPLNEDANVRQLHQGPISLNGQDWNEQSPGNHTDGGLAGSVPIQHSLRAPNYTNPEILNSLGKGTMTPGKIEGSTLVTYVQGPISLNGQDWNDQRPGNHTDGGLTGSLPIQCSPRAPNNTNPEMLFGLGKEAMAPLKGEGSALASHVQCPISSNGQDWNDQNPDNHKDGGLTGSLPIQRSPRAPNNTNPEMFIGLGKGAMTPLNEDANVRQLHQGPISLNGQDWTEQSPGNHTDGGLAGSVPIQHSLRAPNYTNPEILNSLGKGTMTPGKIEGSTLVTYVQGPISLNGQDWNDQRPGNHTDGGLTGSLPIQCSPRAPNNTNPEMLFGLGKEAMTPLVSAVKECASQREDSVNTLLTGGYDETAGKMITKRKRWECDLCNVITETESCLKEHLNGKRHFKKLKASR